MVVVYFPIHKPAKLETRCPSERGETVQRTRVSGDRVIVELMQYKPAGERPAGTVLQACPGMRLDNRMLEELL